MRTNVTGIIAAMVLAGSTQAAKAVLVDDFNDGSTAGWTTRAGTVSESGGLFSGSEISLATMDGQTGSTVGVDALMQGSSGYVAVVLNYSSLSDNLFVKIQDNNGNGLFDRVFFYHGNNGNDGLVGTDYFDLSSEVVSSYFEVSVDGLGHVTANVAATGDAFGGVLTNSYAGTGIGLGFWQNSLADNLYIDGNGGGAVPEPASLALAMLGLAGFVQGRKRRRTA